MAFIPWGVIRSTLFTHFSFSEIKAIVGYTEVDVTKLAGLEQKLQGGASKSQLLSAIDKQVGSMSEKATAKVAAICCEEMLIRNNQVANELDRVLIRAGWTFYDNRLLPIDVFDVSELTALPEASVEDLLKAATRLRDGDLSGALSSACAAIDAATAKIYKKYNLGDEGKDSFQKKISRSLIAINLSTNLSKELDLLGWDISLVKPFNENLNGALNQAAYIMQQLRSNMGDVHGTKPVISSLVYDSLKWSSLILRVLNGK